MKKDFKQELTELINKHSLEKEMRDTPDFILAQVCIDAMAVFSDAIARRDEWRGFRKADEKSSQDAKHNYPDDCNICKDRFKCADFMRTQPIANLIQRFKTTTNKEEKTVPHCIHTCATVLQNLTSQPPTCISYNRKAILHSVIWRQMQRQSLQIPAMWRKKLLS